MSVAGDICTDALRVLGTIALEETPTSAESQQALQLLNDLLETWNIEKLAVYGVRFEVFPFIVGQAAYTIGQGGDFNTVRPVQIEKAYVRDPGGNDFVCNITENFTTYSNIITKTTPSTLPNICYDDSNFPLKTLRFWPVPSDSAYSIVLWMLRPITDFASLVATFSMPPGYKRALTYNLAIELAPRYGKPVTNDMATLANGSKAQIKRINYTIDTMSFDPTLTARGIAFNWLTGGL